MHHSDSMSKVGGSFKHVYEIINVGALLRFQQCIQIISFNAYSTLWNSTETILYQKMYILGRGKNLRAPRFKNLSAFYKWSQDCDYSWLLKSWSCIQSSVVIMWSIKMYYRYVVLQILGQNFVTGWTHIIHPIPRPWGRALGCLSWGFGRKLTAM